MTIDTAKERERLDSLSEEHPLAWIAAGPELKSYSAALDVIDAQAAEIERLRDRVTELEAAISAQEDNELYTGGNLWRFWADKAKESARSSTERAEENVRLRAICEYVAIFHPASLPIDEEVGFDVAAAVRGDQDLLDQEDHSFFSREGET